MSKRKTSTVHSYPEGRKAAKDPQAATPSAGGWPSHFPSPTAIREMVESIVVAFVLAFLFRTFEAEAFVIPTGSMAPTLMGRHKDLLCPVCGYEYQVSATEKENKENISSGTCPMCRFPANIIKDRSYSGDRILVSKFAYQFQEPKRWDVVVFKYPNDPTTNYIKRLVGRPGETIWVYRGDLWVCRGGGEFEIARKESPREDAGHVPAGLRQRSTRRRSTRGDGLRAGRRKRRQTAIRPAGPRRTRSPSRPTAPPASRSGFATVTSCRPMGSGTTRSKGARPRSRGGN